MKSTTEPFKVTCKLYDGRVNSMDGLFSLDSILYHAWFVKYHPETLLGTEEPSGDIPIGLPLRREDCGQRRYYASLGFYHQYDQHIEYWNKRSDFTNKAQYLDEHGKIDTGAGPLKAYHFPCVIRLVSDIEFFGYGTVDKVRDLLSYISAIGKKSAEGWGRVKEWIVESIEDDFSTEGPYGLMRPMPIDEYDTSYPYQIREYPLIPPSWKVDHMGLCYIPEVIRRDN